MSWNSEVIGHLLWLLSVWLTTHIDLQTNIRMHKAFSSQSWMITWHFGYIQGQQGVLELNRMDYTGTLFYLTNYTTLHSDHSYDGRQCSIHCYSTLPCAGTHMFQFCVLQLILGFYSSYLKKVLETISLGLPDMSYLTNIFTVHCSLKFMWSNRSD